MRTPENRFKQALARGEPQIGLWLALADSYAAEVCAGSGFDWLLIDGEHAPNDLRSILGQLQALAPYPAHPIVRIPFADTALIKQVLEIGAQTLLVPMVESAAHAAEIVRAVRYPPRGVRGVGSAIARSARWGAYDDYLDAADAGICVLVQVESVAALADLDGIAKTDGIDGVFIGPADLSASMGRRGQATAPDVRAKIEEAIVRIRGLGKAAGVLAFDEAIARRYLEVGATFIAVGGDTSLLVDAASALAGKFKGAPRSAAEGQRSGY
jgi:4-hydroxy-2-oxoheptanedioate aldolase